ncbi:MAG: hypothetical protein KME19_07310 [Microcoleus vaginatus WJT46-NPBG5]|jgi:hypothetical protein|nr:hypothetical protein [Microcoleus vaginatus WJT46-NPBG5]
MLSLSQFALTIAAAVGGKPANLVAGQTKLAADPATICTLEQSSRSVSFLCVGRLKFDKIPINLPAPQALIAR